MTTNNRIPPVFVEAETGALPSQGDFRKLPAEEVTANDIVRFSDSTLWRVKSVTTFKKSPQIRFALYPCAGGRPRLYHFFPRNWLDVARGF